MKPHLLFAALITATAMQAQNLVPNPSFEEYSECPDQLGQVDRAIGWSRYRGTPDYFNRCDTFDVGQVVSEHLGIPANGFGWQEPATGNAYAGAATWTSFPENWHEQLGAMLTEPLQPGVPVFLSFKASPTDVNLTEFFRYSVEGLGMRFVMEPYLHDTIWPPLPDAAALYMQDPPMDTTAWYQVSGVYVPDSAYWYVVLGNFFNDASITPVVLNPNGTSEAAYVYIDDVCVSYTAADCNVDVGVVELRRRTGMHAFPSPFTDRCTVVFDMDHPEPMDLELRDRMGRIVWRGSSSPGQHSVEIHAPGLPGGVYYLMAVYSMGSLPPIALIHVSP